MEEFLQAAAAAVALLLEALVLQLIRRMLNPEWAPAPVC
jgi:hypothetical protein